MNYRMNFALKIEENRHPLKLNSQSIPDIEALKFKGLDFLLGQGLIIQK